MWPWIKQGDTLRGTQRFFLLGFCYQVQQASDSAACVRVEDWGHADGLDVGVLARAAQRGGGAVVFYATLLTWPRGPQSVAVSNSVSNLRPRSNPLQMQSQCENGASQNCKMGGHRLRPPPVVIVTWCPPCPLMFR